MSHRYHPDNERNDPPEALLWDDCERCDQQAENSLGLDMHKLTAAWTLMLDFELHDRGRHYLTVNERRLGRYLYGVYLLVARAGGIDAHGRFARVPR